MFGFAFDMWNNVRSIVNHYAERMGEAIFEDWGDDDEAPEG